MTRRANTDESPSSDQSCEPKTSSPRQIERPSESATEKAIDISLDVRSDGSGVARGMEEKSATPEQERPPSLEAAIAGIAGLASRQVAPQLAQSAPSEPSVLPVQMPRVPSAARAQRDRQSFPMKLMELLNNEATQAAMCWMPDGDAFAIDPVIFRQTILKDHFNEKFDSFLRKLNRWGFRRITGPKAPSKDIYAYHHKLFHIDFPELCKGMSGGKKRETLYVLPPHEMGRRLAERVPHSLLTQGGAGMMPTGQQVVPGSLLGEMNRRRGPALLDGIQPSGRVGVGPQDSLRGQHQSLSMGYSGGRLLSGQGARSFPFMDPQTMGSPPNVSGFHRAGMSFDASAGYPPLSRYPAGHSGQTMLPSSALSHGLLVSQTYDPPFQASPYRIARGASQSSTASRAGYDAAGPTTYPPRDDYYAAYQQLVLLHEQQRHQALNDVRARAPTYPRPPPYGYGSGGFPDDLF